MKKFNLISAIRSELCLSGFIHLFVSSHVFAGGVVSNPSDHAAKAQAWFLGTAPIEICIERADDYPLTKIQLKEVVRKAFVRWKNYTGAKALKLEWPKDRPFLNFNYKIDIDCKSPKDIQFYFGIMNPRIKEVVGQYTDPRSVAALEKYDPVSGRGQGFVWFENPKNRKSIMWSSLEDQITILATHEVGHIYGNDHVAGTIMRERLGAFLQTATSKDLSVTEAKYYGQSIDHNRELYFAFDRGVKALAFLPSGPSTPTQREAFNRMTKGKLTDGRILMGFIHGGDENSNKANLIFGQETSLGNEMLARETFRIEFDMGSKMPFPFGDSRVFRTVSGTNILTNEHAFEVPAFVIDGKLIVDKQTGQSVRITYARNRGADEYVRLLVKLDGHDSVELFRAFLYNQEGY